MKYPWQNELTYPEKCEWIDLIWAHHEAAKTNDKLIPTSFKRCLWASFVLLFGREDMDLVEDYHFFDEYNAVAWKPKGYVRNAEYEGEAYEELHVSGFKYAIGYFDTLP